MFTILSRNFSRYKQKKLRHGVLFGYFFLAFCFYLLFKPDFSSLPTQGVSKLVCDTNDTKTDVCEMSGDIRINSTSASVLIVSSSDQEFNISREIRPCPRKEAQPWVREWTIIGRTSNIPQCKHTHEVPAILFSTGAFSANYFHDFTDIIIPLFLTVRNYNGEVKLLITDAIHSWWDVKFDKILKKLSNYEIIKIDEEKVVHCFQSAILGLKYYHRDLMIDSSSSPYTMKDFRNFLSNTYSLKKISAIKLGQSEKQSPLLLIIARKLTRTFLNAEEIGAMAKELGFTVIIAEPDHYSASRFVEVVNSCDVMMGVHGAGLANMLFLPENAVLIQVLPFGAEWAVDCFGSGAKEMNVRHLEYRIEAEESTLIEQYPAGHEVLSNPDAVLKKGWDVFGAIYLKQNIKVKLDRFRPTLLKALELLHQ